MPGYMCDTVFIPFVKEGWELCFYHIDKNMKADREELEALIWDEQPGLLFIHDYYGLDTWKELRLFLSQCRHKNILIMEDVTQAYYLNVDTEADYVIGSLRKWYAIPDGGFVTTNHTISGEVIVKDDTFAMERFGMLSKKWDYLEEIQDLEGSLNDISIKQLQKQKEEYLTHNRKLEERLDNYEQITRISALSQKEKQQGNNAEDKVDFEWKGEKTGLLNLIGKSCHSKYLCNVHELLRSAFTAETVLMRRTVMPKLLPENLFRCTYLINIIT